MSKTPLVSILIPAYNAEKFVNTAIESAFNQIYSNVEVIVVNDGSIDATAEAVKPYLKDKRVIYFEQSNGGVSRARNKAFELSHGQYITFLDPDDFYHSDKVAKEALFLESYPNFGAVYCRFVSFYDSNPSKLLKYQRSSPSGDIFKPLLKWNLINPNTVMIRREVFNSVGGFDPELRDAEDWDLWLRLASRGVKFGLVNEELHYNRLRSGSHSRFENQFRMKLSNLRSFERIFRSMPLEEKKDYHADKIIRRVRLKLAIAYLVAADGENFRKYLKLAWQSPFWILFYYPSATLSIIIPPKIISRFIQKIWAFKQRRLLGGR